MSGGDQQTEARVVDATITHADGMGDLDFLLAGSGSAKAEFLLDDGGHETFSWFHDEVSYSEAELVGKTIAEIKALHARRDLAYLRS